MFVKKELYYELSMLNNVLQGGWALLQNCHLGLNFMDELLDTLLETQQIHEEFRVWITTEPHNHFPISLLQVINMILRTFLFQF